MVTVARDGSTESTDDPQTRDAAGFWDRLETQHSMALWRLPETAPEPVVPERAHVWHWRDMYPLLQEAAEVMDIDADAQRRVIMFRNPGQKHPGTTQTLNAALQLVVPGEVAPAHRHTMAALRFVIDAENGYTVVNGEPIPMHNGDLILTPGWTWHDHKNAHAQRPMVWFDGLDVPFVHALRQVFYQDFPGNSAQPLTQPPAASAHRFGAGTLLPPGERPRSLHSPLSVYPWATAYAAAKGLQAAGGGDCDPFDGAILEYVNPLTGGHVLPTIACFLQVLAPGQRTRAHRHTTSTVYFVARGSGFSVVNGRKLSWHERDTMVIPTWAWHEHAPDSGTEAVLFSMSDLPILEPFGYVRTEAFSATEDGRQPLG